MWSGIGSPFIFNADFKVGTAAGCATFLLEAYRPLLLSKAVWRSIAGWIVRRTTVLWQRRLPRITIAYAVVHLSMLAIRMRLLCETSAAARMCYRVFDGVLYHSAACSSVDLVDKPPLSQPLI